MVFSKRNPIDEPTNKKATFKKLQDSPDYREAKDRLDELQSQKAELQRTVDELTAQIGEGDSGQSEIREQASQMLSGGTAVAIAKPDTRLELNDARQQLAIVTEACEMQQKAVNQVTGNCQVEMAAERKPGHVETVKRIDAAIYELENSIAAERLYREQLMADAGGSGLPLIALPGRFGWQRGNSWEMFRAWRLAMAKRNYITFDGRR